MTGPKDKRGADGGKPRRARGALGRRLMRVPMLRRWYVKRTLKFIDRSREKGRRLPEGLAETARQLSRVPKQQRAKVFEEAIMAGADEPGMSREFRRAASRKRLSTKSDTRYRSGRPPGAGRQGRPRAR